MKFIFTFQQISQNCPKDFLESEQFAYSTIELCLGYLFKILHRCALKEIFGSCVQFCFKSCREKIYCITSGNDINKNSFFYVSDIIKFR